MIPAGFYCTFKSASGATKGLPPQKVNIKSYVKLSLGRFLAWFMTMFIQKSWQKTMSDKAALSDVPNGSYFLRWKPPESTFWICNWFEIWYLKINSCYEFCLFGKENKCFKNYRSFPIFINDLHFIPFADIIIRHRIFKWHRSCDL